MRSHVAWTACASSPKSVAMLFRSIHPAPAFVISFVGEVAVAEEILTPFSQTVPVANSASTLFASIASLSLSLSIRSLLLVLRARA